MREELQEVSFAAAPPAFEQVQPELTEEQQEWLMAYETLNNCGIVDLDDEVRPMFCLD